MTILYIKNYGSCRKYKQIAAGLPRCSEAKAGGSYKRFKINFLNMLNEQKLKTVTMMGFLWSVIKPYKWWYLLMIQAPIIGSFYKVVNSYAVKIVVDAFIASDKPKYVDLIYPVSVYIGAIIVLETAWRISHYSWMKSQPFVRADLISRTYEHVLNHTYKFFQSTHSGAITSKIKGVVNGYNNFWMAVHHRLINPTLEILVAIIALAFINIELFFFMLTWCLVFFPIMIKMSFKVSRLAKVTTDSQHKAMGFVADNITNIFSLFSFSSRKRELKKLDRFLANDTAKKDYDWIKYDLKVAFVGVLFNLIMLSSLFVFMIHLRRTGIISVGDFVFVMTVSYFIVDNIWRASYEISDFLGKMGDFKSSFALLEVPQEVDHLDAKKIKVEKGDISFKNIYFGHNRDGVFKNLSLDIKAGEKVGLVGYSGSGKTTLIGLLMKNYIAKKGDITVDGQSIYDVNSDSLRSQIALIPQDTLLFHRSIGENIGYAKPKATKRQIIAAAKKAHIHEFISCLEDGYDTLVGERGVKLSGGQRQRVAIARAILKDSPILILDEATSALDSKTEKMIQGSIDSLIKDKSKTIIAVAHRLSTLKNMDRIIVLNKGKIIEEGTHEQLLRNEKSLYRKIWQLQGL